MRQLVDSLRFDLMGLLLAAILISGCASDSGDGEALADPDPVLTTEFALFESGEPATLGDYMGTPLVVNLWASYCPNCITEMPDFETVSNELESQVMFIGIGLDDDRSAAEELLEATGVTYLIGTDDAGQLARHLGSIAMPTTAFITADGELVDVWNGQLTADALRSRIEEHLLSGGGGLASSTAEPATADADDTFDEELLALDGGIFPALDDPAMVPASTATWLNPNDIVMGVVDDSGVGQAYPVDQMAYHHVANTRLSGEPFVVTY